MASERRLAGQVPAAGSGAVLTAPDRIRSRAAGDSAAVDGPSATHLGPRRDGLPPRSRTPNSSGGSDTVARAAVTPPCDIPTGAPDTWSQRASGGIDSRMNAAVSFLFGMSPVVKQRGDPLAQGDRGPHSGRRARQQNPVPAWRHGVGVRTKQLPQPALDPVARNRSAEPAPYDHTDLARLQTRILANADQSQRASGKASTAVKDPSDLHTARDPPHWARAAVYTVRRFLPLARRRLSTRRPSVVDMRLRNP